MPAASTQLPPIVVRMLMDATQFVATMESVSRRMHAMTANQAMTNFGAALTRNVTVPLTVMAGLAVRELVQFDRAMTESLSIMQNVTPAIRAEMENLARTMGRETVTSADDLAKSYYYLTQSGLDAAGAMASLSTVNKFAIAGMFDQKKATDILTDAQAALGKDIRDNARANAAEMTQIGDMLVGASRVANSSVEQLSTALTSKAGAAMKLFNVATSEGIAVLGAFADQGIRAELAGNTYDRALRLLAKSAVTNGRQQELMGFSVHDANGKMRHMADIVDNLDAVLKGLNDEQKTAALLMLGFAAKSQQAITPLLGMGDHIRKLQADIDAADGAIEDVSRTVQQSFSAQLQILWNQIKDVAIGIGKKLVPFVMILSGAIRVLVNDWRSLHPWLQNLTISTGIYVAAIGPLILAIAALRFASVQLGAAWTFLQAAQVRLTASAGLQRAAMAGGVLALFMIARALYEATLASEGFNDSLQRNQELTNKWVAMTQKRMNIELDTIKAMDDKQKKMDALQAAEKAAMDQLRTKERLVADLTTKEKKRQENKGIMDQGRGMAFGDPEAQLAAQNLKTARDEMDTYANHILRIQEMKKKLEAGEEDIADKTKNALESMEGQGIMSMLKDGGDLGGEEMTSMLDNYIEGIENAGKATQGLQKEMDVAMRGGLTWFKREVAQAKERNNLNEQLAKDIDKKIEKEREEAEAIRKKAEEEDRERAKTGLDTKDKWEMESGPESIRKALAARLPDAINMRMRLAAQKYSGGGGGGGMAKAEGWNNAAMQKFGESERQRRAEDLAVQQLAEQRKIAFALEQMAKDGKTLTQEQIRFQAAIIGN